MSEAAHDAAPVERLRQLQSSLQDLYGLDHRHDIADFVTTDAGTLERLGIDVGAGVAETVFVHCRQESIEISVYFDAQTLARLGGSDDGPGLNDYCLAAEGVSHFLFIIERAGQARQTSGFELELQAEVDKYLLLAGYCGDRLPHAGDDVHARLFDTSSLRDGMDAPMVARYADANRYAARYCRWLRQLAHPHRPASAVEEVRDFYRLPLNEKVKRIESRRYV